MYFLVLSYLNSVSKSLSDKGEASYMAASKLIIGVLNLCFAIGLNAELIDISKESQIIETEIKVTVMGDQKKAELQEITALGKIEKDFHGFYLFIESTEDKIYLQGSLNLEKHRINKSMLRMCAKTFINANGMHESTNFGLSVVK